MMMMMIAYNSSEKEYEIAVVRSKRRRCQLEVGLKHKDHYFLFQILLQLEINGGLPC